MTNDYILVVNTIRDNASQLYQERIPVATRENFSEVGQAIMDYKPTKNEFIDAIYNKVAFAVADVKRWTNKLKALKGGNKLFGEAVEEQFVNPIIGEEFDGNAQDLLAIAKADVKVVYHTRNRRGKYKVSISNAMLRKAFKSPEEMGALVNYIITQMYNGDEMDEYLLMKQLINEALVKDAFVSYEVEYDGKGDSCKDVIKMIRTLAPLFDIPKTDFNSYNKANADAIAGGTLTAAVNWCPADRQVLIIRADVEAACDVEVLASAMNMNKTDFLQRKIVVDDFGDSDTLCLLCDESIFKIYDEEYTLEEFNNGSTLTTTYFLHHWQMMSLSPFGNAVAIKSKASA